MLGSTTKWSRLRVRDVERERVETASPPSGRGRAELPTRGRGEANLAARCSQPQHASSALSGVSTEKGRGFS